ncbi:hypothetical protein [Agaribacterium haliotis]|uniref:hypothetical protein n=1 Tax=Agaribacterium haliotis TaxID=2013869 RepID=UPI000BB54E69|nr:hypothetical protein [Agaribacterium haliotis]
MLINTSYKALLAVSALALAACGGDTQTSLPKSTIWYTYGINSELEEFQDFAATGIFWGHMPQQQLHDDAVLGEWVAEVAYYRDQGLDFNARGEFDWGFQWFIDYAEQPDQHYVRNLDGDIVTYFFMGDLSYNGYPNGWLSNHSPLFVDYYKLQVDRMFEADISHIMFDSQTSSVRSTQLLGAGGDFSEPAIKAFRNYMADKYTMMELYAMGIENIDSFDYGDYLRDAGYTNESFQAQASAFGGGVTAIPLIEDYTYFNRDVLNEKMNEVFAYIRSKDSDIDIGATTSMIDVRGYLNSDELTYWAGEAFMFPDFFPDQITMATIPHMKAAESIDKTMVYFPYPFEFANLQQRNVPRQARGWIAQAYAMGAVFSIPARVWIGGEDINVWEPGADNYRDLYQFVDRHKQLFDGYKAYSNVAYIAPMQAYVDSSSTEGTISTFGSVTNLMLGNYSFDFLMFGDAGNSFAPSLKELSRFDALVTDADASFLSEEHQALLDLYSEKVVDSSDSDKLASLVKNKISATVAGAPADHLVSALPRTSSSHKAPYVIHLLNRPFDESQGITPQLDDVELRISKNFFAKKLKGAKLHLPDGSSQELELKQDDSGDYLLAFDGLAVWGLVEIAHR